MWRKRLLIAVWIVLVLTNTATTQIPDDRLIVPGDRIGRWTLRMTLPDLIRVLGQPLPFFHPHHLFPNVKTDLELVGWVRWGLYAATRDGRRLELLQADFLLGDLASFKTSKDIGKGSIEEAVLAAYGNPTGRPGGTLVFDNIGLAVAVGNGGVYTIAVFRPGSAGGIWRY